MNKTNTFNSQLMGLRVAACLPFRILPGLALTALLMSGCDDGSSSKTFGGSNATASRLSGHVLDDDGPILKAKINAKDASGVIIAETALDGQSEYDLTIPAHTRFPLILNVHPVDKPNETLRAAVTDGTASLQDISPVSTIVVDTALSLGGLTEGNLAKAAGAAIAQRRKSGSGGGGTATSEGFKGDPTKQYGGWH